MCPSYPEYPAYGVENSTVRGRVEMSDIQPGTRVLVRTAFNEWVERRAVTGVLPGHDFPVVRVCLEDEWLSASAANERPAGSAWPAEDVRPAELATT